MPAPARTASGHPLSLDFTHGDSSLPPDDLHLALQKIAGALGYFRANGAVLREMPFGEPEERGARLQKLAELLRAALENPARVEDARLELQRVKAEEVRSAAMFAIAASSYLKDGSLLSKFAADGKTEQLLDWFRRIRASRPTALRVLGTEDLEKLRARGFLSEEE